MHPDRDTSASDNPYASPGDHPPALPAERPRQPLAAGAKPWRTIWTQPRATVRRLVESDPGYGVTFLAGLGGISHALDRASLKSSGDTLSLPVILGVACVLGPLGGLLGLWVSSLVLRVAGAWIGGVATSRQLRTAIAWATVPTLCGSTMWVPQLALFGAEMFTSDTPKMDANPTLVLLLLASAAVQIVGGLWTAVIGCQTIAEVQGFRSGWAGLGNVLLALLLFLVPLFGIAILVAALPLFFR